jgi:hypothetical protein
MNRRKVPTLSNGRRAFRNFFDTTPSMLSRFSYLWLMVLRKLIDLLYVVSSLSSIIFTCQVQEGQTVAVSTNRRCHKTCHRHSTPSLSKSGLGDGFISHRTPFDASMISSCSCKIPMPALADPFNAREPSIAKPGRFLL